MKAIDKNITILKGLHPGFILERELQKRGLSKRSFALSIDEYPQLLGDITKGKRKINPSLSVRIGRALGLDESFFSILQTYHDIRMEKKKQAILIHPDLSKFRSVIFWDTDIKTIDWEKNKANVIRRVVERGNKDEIEEILRFYGKKDVAPILRRSRNLSPAAKNYLKNYS